MLVVLLALIVLIPEHSPQALELCLSQALLVELNLRAQHFKALLLDRLLVLALEAIQLESEFLVLNVLL